jgi:predicted ATPase
VFRRAKSLPITRFIKRRKLSEEKKQMSDQTHIHTNNNLFIITGGPGAGKTTTLLELGKLGFQHLPEVARQIIQEQVRDHGTALPWADREHYAHLMLQRSIQSYREHTNVSRATFADRGIPDTLAYARLIQFAGQDVIRAACDRYRYAKRVFVAPPWREIYVTDQERKQDFREAEDTYQQLKEAYQECNYDLTELPRSSPRDRAEFILTQLAIPR